MSESFNVSGGLLFIKDSLIQLVNSGKQNVLSFRVLIRVLPADTSFEFNAFHNFSYSSLRNMLERKSFVKLKFFLDFKEKFQLHK